MDTVIALLAIALVAHMVKPPFRSRAMRTDGNMFAGLVAAVIFLALSLINLGATVAAVIMMGVSLWN
jgi:hypothetical protein